METYSSEPPPGTYALEKAKLAYVANPYSSNFSHTADKPRSSTRALKDAFESTKDDVAKRSGDDSRRPLLTNAGEKES